MGATKYAAVEDGVPRRFFPETAYLQAVREIVAGPFALTPTINPLR
jgi:hypothetical protein